VKKIVVLLSAVLFFGAAYAENDALVLSKQDYLKLLIKAHISQFQNFNVMVYIIEDTHIKVDVGYRRASDKSLAQQITVNICDFIREIKLARGFRLNGRAFLDKKKDRISYKGAAELKKYMEKYGEGVIIK
jgi:hypothetical protein